MPESYYDEYFPKLKSLGFRRTSEPAYYNCIAFAVRDYNRAWWPNEYPPKSGDYWPKGVPIEPTIAAFAAAFSTVGFVICRTRKHQRGKEKIALDALNNEVTHTARQMADGTWRSKLGPDEDIEHTLEGLEGPFYGVVVAYFARKIDFQAHTSRPHGRFFRWLYGLVDYLLRTRK